MASSKHDATAPARLAVTRRREIADLLDRDGAVTVQALQRRFGVSSMTARRDLDELERSGLARRTHGGAVAPSATAHEDAFEHRVGVDVDAKRRLGAAAAALVEPSETVFVDSSSTGWFAVQALLAARTPVTIVTNAVPVMELVSVAEPASAELIGVGGSLRRRARSFVGPHAVRTVREHFADKALLSVKGVTPDGTLTDADPLEAEVKRAMIAHAQTPLLLLDGTKLRTRGLVAIAGAETLGLALVVDAEPAELEPLTVAGVEVRWA